MYDDLICRFHTRGEDCTFGNDDDTPVWQPYVDIMGGVMEPPAPLYPVDSPTVEKPVILDGTQKVLVTSRYCVEHEPQLALADHILISIRNIGSKPAAYHRNNSLKSVLFIEFDDCERDARKSITYKQARAIADFYVKWRHVPIVFCQCEAGISRSAGCAAAILEFTQGAGWMIFDDDRYFPNIRVYGRVYRAMYEAFKNVGRRFRGPFRKPTACRKVDRSQFTRSTCLQGYSYPRNGD